MAPAKLVTGVFEAERFWQDEAACTLPSAKIASPFVDDMDMLLTAFCGPGDVLLTRRAFDGAQRAYLQSLGITFDSVVLPACGGNIYEDLVSVSDPVLAHLPQGLTLDAFAVLPSMQAFAHKYRLSACLPALEAVKKVNSKAFSTSLNETLGLMPQGIIARDTKAIRAAIEGSSQPFLVKETFGVSGKGSFLVDTPLKLTILLRHLDKQVAKGKSLCLIVEPFLPKKADFSCQFDIDNAGGIQLHATQMVLNNDLSYGGTVTPDAPFLRLLEKKRYFDTIHQTARHLFGQGYFGHVCIDSMLLEDDTLVPIVEINARKSMSLIKHSLDVKLGSPARSALVTKDFTSDAPVTFEQAMAAFERKALLFGKREAGFVPLHVCSHLANAQKEVYTNRVYALSIDKEPLDSDWPALTQQRR